MLLSCSDTLAINDIDNGVHNFKVPCKLMPSSNNLNKINMSIFNHNSKVIATGGDDGIINFFNTSLEHISCIDDSDSEGTDITSLAFNINSNYLGYSSLGGFLKVWDLKSSSVKLNYKLPSNYVTSMCFNSDSSILTAGTFKGEILNFNIPNMSKSNTKFQLNSKITCIKYSPFYASYIASSFVDGSIKIIDTNSGTVVNNFSGYHQGAATGICFSPINKLFLASVSTDSRINFYDILAKKHIKTINTSSPLTSISFHTDGQTIAVGSTNGTISIYDLRYSSSPKLIISDHNTAINHLEFSLKSNKPNTNAPLNNSKIDLNSSRVNKSFDSQEGNLGFPIQNHLNNSQLQNSYNKANVENKINFESNKMKKSESEKNGESEYNLPKENPNLKKANENYHKLIEKKKKELENPQPLNQGIILSNEKSGNKPPFPTSQNLNRERTSIDSEKEQKQFKKIDFTNNIINNLKTANNINANEDLENKTQNFIKSCLDIEMSKMKQFIHEEINSLHVDLIRQFEIQHEEFIKSMKNFSLVNNKMAKEIDTLKKENSNLKSQFF